MKWLTDLKFIHERWDKILPDNSNDQVDLKVIQRDFPFLQDGKNGREHLNDRKQRRWSSP